MMAEHVAGFGELLRTVEGSGWLAVKVGRWVVLVGGGGLLGFHG